jgi:RNA polymerase sigma-70 factor (ECF subfamily)
MNDDGLIAAVAGGDDAALRELFWRHAPWLATRLRSVLPAAEVEDVIQETFLAVWRGAGRYRPAGLAGLAGPTDSAGSAGGWLWGIARRQAALLLRRRGPAAVSLPDLLAADGARAGDPAEVAVTRADIDQAVAALGPAGGPEREVWRLLYLEDRPVAEVAALTGVPSGTVKSRAHRVRQLLRAALHAADGPAREHADRAASGRAERVASRPAQGPADRAASGRAERVASRPAQGPADRVASGPAKGPERVAEGGAR